jgi:hypothetical protein
VAGVQESSAILARIFLSGSTGGNCLYQNLSGRNICRVARFARLGRKKFGHETRMPKSISELSPKRERGGIAMMQGWRYIKRVDASGVVYEVMRRRNDAGSEPTWLLRATDGSRRQEYVTDDALRQEWMRV